MTSTTEKKSAPKPGPPQQKRPYRPDHERAAAHYRTDGIRTNQPHYRKGDVWMVAADPSNPAVGTEIWSNRPALIVSADLLNDKSGFCQVVYLTASDIKRSSPVHVPVPSHDNPGKDVLALCEQIHTIDHSRLRHKLGFVPGSRMRDVDSALGLSLSLGVPTHANGLLRKWEEYIKTLDIDMRKEIDALAGKTTDERVEALTRALELVTAEKDSWRQLYLACQSRPEAMRNAAEAMSRTETADR